MIQSRSIPSAVSRCPRSSCSSRAIRLRSSSLTDCKEAESALSAARDSRSASSARWRSVISLKIPV